MIIFKKEQVDTIIKHCQEGLPNESCGLIAGIVKGEDKVITNIYLLKNIDQSAEHFSMDVKEQFKAIADLRKNGWELIGNFHSHPNTPSRPSQEDIKLAFDPNISYMILSLQYREQPILNSFLIKDNNVSKQEYIILE
jgi:proteasome lid subunit RPN8/RPN11